MIIYGSRECNSYITYSIVDVQCQVVNFSKFSDSTDDLFPYLYEYAVTIYRNPTFLLSRAHAAIFVRKCVYNIRYYYYIIRIIYSV